jgi:hypothetical protein
VTRFAQRGINGDPTLAKPGARGSLGRQRAFAFCLLPSGVRTFAHLNILKDNFIATREQAWHMLRYPNEHACERVDIAAADGNHVV